MMCLGYVAGICRTDTAQDMEADYTTAKLMGKASEDGCVANVSCSDYSFGA